MEEITRFFRHANMSFRALFGLLNPKVYLIVMVLSPISQLLFFSMLAKYIYHNQDISGYVASNALLLCVMNSIFGVMQVVRSDRQMGTLQLVIASPTNKFSIFLSRSVFHILNGFATALFGLFFGMFVFHVSIHWNLIPVLILIWVVSIFATSGLGLLLGSCSFWSPSMHLWSNLFADLLLLLSGANYPHSVMPNWMFIISDMLPMTRGVELTKVIVRTGFQPSMLPIIGQELLIGCIYFIIGIFFIRYAEYAARSKGTLDLE